MEGRRGGRGEGGRGRWEEEEGRWGGGREYSHESWSAIPWGEFHFVTAQSWKRVLLLSRLLVGGAADAAAELVLSGDIDGVKDIHDGEVMALFEKRRRELRSAEGRVGGEALEEGEHMGHIRDDKQDSFTQPTRERNSCCT